MIDSIRYLFNVNPTLFIFPGLSSVLQNHRTSQQDWETRISRWHLRLGDRSHMETIAEYLEMAQDVEIYGAPLFEARNAQDHRRWIAVDAVGVNIYESTK